MSTATHESEPIAPDATPAVAATGSALGAAPSSESDRSDFEVQIAIQAIASRILGSALLERAQEADPIAT